MAATIVGALTLAILMRRGSADSRLEYWPGHNSEWAEYYDVALDADAIMMIRELINVDRSEKFDKGDVRIVKRRAGADDVVYVVWHSLESFDARKVYICQMRKGGAVLLKTIDTASW